MRDSYGEEVRRYTLGWWVFVQPVVTPTHFMVVTHARLPDADHPQYHKFTGPVMTGEIVASIADQMDDMKDPIKRHMLITSALRRIWMRVAEHEFEEWLRLDGERVFTPLHHRAGTQTLSKAR